MTDLRSDLPYLKFASRAKHRILANYLQPWGVILGSAGVKVGQGDRVAYVDCFAGGGVYVDENGAPLPGSPLIALRQAGDYALSHQTARRILLFVEQNHETAERLRALLAGERPNLPSSVEYEVYEENAQTFVRDLLARVSGTRDRLIPTFFFVDPYGHPIAVPVMRQILRMPRTEILVNLMWWRINMDLGNRAVQRHVDILFGDAAWRNEPFMQMSGDAREDAFLAYFVQQLGAKFHLDFSVRYSPEDRVPGGAGRTKYYLIHLSNHPKAARLMKSVMFGESDVASELGFSGQASATAASGQMAMFDQDGPDLVQLWGRLRRDFTGRTIGFADLILATLSWPYAEKHYRQVLLDREKREITIDRRVSRRHGLTDGDVVTFPMH